MSEEISDRPGVGSEIPETDAYARRLAVLDPLRAPAFRAAIEALHLPEGSRGLHVGCGIGLQALLLAQAVGPAGHVTGLDQDPAFLAYARTAAKRAGLAERCTFRQGDLRALPTLFGDDDK